MEKLSTIEQYRELAGKEDVIFMFSADWCPDCRVIEPILPEVMEKYNQYKFFYVDRDDFIELCQELNIFGIPSFVAFSKGEEIGRFVSKDRKTQEEIEQFIEGLSSNS
ncbi:thioredoxin family protein [Priestia filamentosa]|uniref:Thiol reductase thioredoxin n=1 Tax=Priestia filamentosa TaxID=1402861 RepID=A0A1X7CQ73_9BACI|nr:thioredoxin family protein [Priestia filamentosa]AKO94432.1 thiol reductase thioredoxin [Priestia filamentosa]MDT3764726.1 thioredoxin family protein [Priestia filamentosa]OXS70831.1 thiol reductase thioredoxin [Priestia filamentosa]RJS66462.1 thioredoxin [Priestia filamentosa]WCM15327.1 thioredoxin family protein [Priestia filamentosa]